MELLRRAMSCLGIDCLRRAPSSTQSPPVQVAPPLESEPEPPHCRRCIASDVRLKRLSCGHLFCEHCANRIVNQAFLDIEGLSDYPCPMCKSISRLNSTRSHPKLDRRRTLSAPAGRTRTPLQREVIEEVEEEEKEEWKKTEEDKKEVDKKQEVLEKKQGEEKAKRDENQEKERVKEEENQEEKVKEEENQEEEKAKEVDNQEEEKVKEEENKEEDKVKEEENQEEDKVKEEDNQEEKVKGEENQEEEKVKEGENQKEARQRIDVVSFHEPVMLGNHRTNCHAVN
ncbi:hypothetical protein GJAV_G00103630 [Gymnothorax javanicus]|nr:hypothetical protein GJAV_G00103630 [Gymnothorax javanicus]